MSQENVELVRSICAPWEHGDFRSTEWADENIEFVRADKMRATGIEEMGALWRDWLAAFDEFASASEEFIDAGDRVLVLVRFRGRGKGSGAPAQDFAGASLFTLRDRSVVGLALYEDVEEAREDAGLAE